MSFREKKRNKNSVEIQLSYSYIHEYYYSSWFDCPGLPISIEFFFASFDEKGCLLDSKKFTFSIKSTQFLN